MITAVKRPAGEPGGKRLRELTPLPVTQMVLDEAILVAVTPAMLARPRSLLAG